MGGIWSVAVHEDGACLCSQDVLVEAHARVQLAILQVRTETPFTTIPPAHQCTGPFWMWKVEDPLPHDMFLIPIY